MIKKEPDIFNSEQGSFNYKEIISPKNSDLTLLIFGYYSVSCGFETDSILYHNEESVLLCIGGEGKIKTDNKEYYLKYYDTIYMPRNISYTIKNTGNIDLKIAIVRAPSKIDSVPVHSNFEEIKKDPKSKKIRKLDGKDVYVMVGEEVEADNLTVGYSIFQPCARSWPIHKHEDQEEIYVFLKGYGAMEVFESEETKTFIREVKVGDIVSIPFNNYHPVFSFDAELHFIWAIAGNRYWIGDKDNAIFKKK